MRYAMKALRALCSSHELLHCLMAVAYISSPVAAVLTFPTAPSPNMDLSHLGRVAVAGNFDSASLFQYTQETEGALNPNGSISLLSRFPSGAFASLQSSDANIQAMCSFVVNGKLQGVVVGGNFTSLGGVASPGIALFMPDTAEIKALPGLSGRVNALYCDASAGTVYVGGSFTVGNLSTNSSTNAVVRNATAWSSLPFIGFNGAVTSITQAPDGNIVFGGSFDGLGNSTTPQIADGQVIPVSSGTLQAGPNSLDASFSDPKNIVCKDPNADGPGTTWLLADNSPGMWTATFPYGFNPTKLRLHNTKIDGRGTQTFRFTAIPLNGIMNFSYVDPKGVTNYCDSECPLPEGDTTLQDFRFVNSVGMNGFRLDISAWYGKGGGLSSLELFEDDIYTYAVSALNEPQCPDVPNAATIQTAGTWTTLPARSSVSDYVMAQGSNLSDNTKVVFLPDIRQAGNYSATLYTPGCLQDNTCNTRGSVNITSNLASAPNSASSVSIFQTNNFDKYDQIFLGHVDATSSSFKPSITLTASTGQNGQISIVAQRVRFELVSSTGGLNGLYEYNPKQATVDLNFRKSTIDSAATSFDTGAVVNSLAVSGSTMYVGGSFTSEDANNFATVAKTETKPPQGGLNGAVQTLYQAGNAVYVGGSFSSTRDKGGPQGLSGIAVYNISANAWNAVGAGVRGSVTYIVPFQINLSSGKNTDLALAVSGKFDQINGFNGKPAIDSKDFAVWVTTRNNWLQNLDISTISLSGILTAYADVPDKNPPMFAGSVSSYDVDTKGAFELVGSGSPTLGSFPVQIGAPVPSSSKRKRAVSTHNITGVITGLYYNQDGKNLTVLGGHFSAPASNGSTITNLLVIDGKNSDKVTGLTTGVSSDSVIRAVAVSGNSLYAGGSVSGTVRGASVDGLVVFDLGSSDYADTQPEALQGSNVVVNAIASQPNSQSIYVGGDFDSAGSFDCPSLCVFDNGRQQWTSPGDGLSGQVAAMVWADETRLLIAGNLTVNNSATSISLYDTGGHFFSAVTTKDGPATGSSITALTSGNANGSAAWVAGVNADGSTPFLTKFDGNHWINVPTTFGTGSVIRGLQIFTLTKNHDSTPLLDKTNSLLVTGQLVLPNFGNVSAALYNGTTFTPFLLTSSADGSPGSVAGVFVQNPSNFFKTNRHNLAVGFIVLIGLAVSLAIVFLVMFIWLMIMRYHRKLEGYQKAPSPPMDGGGHDNLQRIPPEQLLGALPHGRSAGGRGWATKH